MKGLYLLDAGSFEQIYGPDEQRDIAELVDIYAPPQTTATAQENPAILAEADVLFSGWGGPRLDDAFLAAAPRLKAFFYGAGATGHLLTPTVWERGIRVTSAYGANAVPVAEFTLAAIIFSLKSAWQSARRVRETESYPPKGIVPGCYGTTVGLVSLGAIGREVCRRLAALDVRVIAYDPFISEDEVRELGVELVASLDAVFRRSQVVSIHTPWLPETERLIRGAHIAALPEGAALINTSRGAVIAEDEMLEVAASRPDLQFVLDVTYPEPPAPGSPMYRLPNIFLTPHIAGSLNNECRRMGRYMVEELRRYCAGEPLLWEIRPDMAQNTSHRPKG